MKVTHLIAGALVAATASFFLPACQSNMKIPADAALMASGTGNSSYTAADSGTVYVYDKSWDKLVYVGDIHAGQTVKVDANADKLYVDGQVRVEQIPLGEGSEYQFFLRPNHTVVERTIIEHPDTTHRETVIEREVP